MSRYTGPRRRIVRRLDTELPGLTQETPGDRAYPPGQHGQWRRKRASEYAVRLGGRCTALPDRQDVTVQVDERMVVEFYAR